LKKVKDPISGFSHLIGMIASIVGLIFLIIYSVQYGEGTYDIVSFTIFGAGLILLYAASTFYHLLNLNEKATLTLRKIDHIMIYILIASTYTPIVLGPLRGGWGWSIFGIVWGLAISRTVSNYILAKRTKMAYNRHILSNGLDCSNCNISYDCQV
jgi:hemolysin III